MSSIISKLPDFSVEFKTFLIKKGMQFFNNIHNVEKTPEHFRGDFHRLFKHLYDAGGELMALNSEIQFSLHDAVKKNLPEDIITQLVIQLSQIENDWNQANAEGWIEEPFSYLKF